MAEEVDKDKIDDAINSTVIINGEKMNTSAYGGGKESAISFNGVGAGVLVDSRGYIITNYHVIEGIRNIQVKTYDGREYIGQSISYDLSTDIALVKITPDVPLVPIVIGDSSSLRILTRIVVAGHPFGYSFSALSGDISGLYRDVPVKENLKYNNMIQISAGINPGNSGGPLLTTNGEMIGLNSALRQEANQIAFAIPVDFVMEVGAELLHQHTSQYCYHGIRFKEFDVNLIGTRNAKVSDYKILAIASIDPESPAAAAGLLPGDILLEANNMQLDRKLDLQRSLIDKKEGDVIHLVFDRDGSPYQTELVLKSPKSRTNGRNHIAGTANRPAAASQVQVASNQQSMSSRNPSQNEAVISDYVWNSFGLRVTPVTEEDFQRRNAGMLSHYIFEGAVEVLDVKSDGLFASLKIQKGDMLAAIITPKDSWNITLVSDLKYLAERWTPEDMGGNKVKVVVVRNRQLLEGTLPVSKNSVANSTQKITIK
ncbi:MAG: trypsin-like peptidase domain-containing protein [Planctomycetaceae bacterium]|nr:trypsin-like peptidase domain-containing protein [Planctomycetaceae bacterium]